MKDQQDKTQILNQYYSNIYRRYDLINRLFTFGNDRKWRSYTAQDCLKEKPVAIIDLCCGTGDLCINLSRRSMHEVQITGFDINHQMLETARIKTKKREIKNIEFVQGDVAKMPFKDSAFDAMTIGFGFRNLTFENKKAEIHLSEMSRILKKKATLHILESSVPSNLFIRTLYNLYLRLVLIPLGAIMSGNRSAYTYLAKSSANFFNTKEVAEILMKYGLKIQQTKTFLFGAANLITAVKE